MALLLVTPCCRNSGAALWAMTVGTPITFVPRGGVPARLRIARAVRPCPEKAYARSAITRREGDARHGHHTPVAPRLASPGRTQRCSTWRRRQDPAAAHQP